MEFWNVIVVYIKFDSNIKNVYDIIIDELWIWNFFKLLKWRILWLIMLKIL